MNCINKISELGNSFFDLVSQWIIPLPGILKGFITLVFLGLVAMGILSLLKKSLKVFGFILLAIAVFIFVSTILNK